MKDNEATNALTNNLQEQGIEVRDMGDYGNLPDAGLMQVKTAYSTAVQVIKPRDINQILARCETEAAIAGDSFYYSWSQSGKIIEGNTVGAALMMVRNWGNCAVDVKVMETQNGYIFYGAFIDLETGFNLVRPFKMSKQIPKNKQGRDIYTGDRGKDIIFQIGASKAIRNVALNAIPKYVSDKVLAMSKKNVVGQVEKMGKETAIQKVINKAHALKIPFDRIEANYGKKESWDTDKIVAVMGAIRVVEDGIESIDEVFADKVAVNGEPEIKNSKIDEKKAHPEDASDKDNQPEIPFNPEEENDPDYWAKLILECPKKEWKKFKEENKVKMSVFTGKDEERLDKLISEKDEAVKGK